MSDRDRELVARVLSQDAAAVCEFYAQHAGVVRGVLVRMVGSGDADDLVQETFLRALAHLGRFRHDASLSWWLSRIAAHVGVRWLRGEHRAKARQLALPEPAAAPDPEHAVLAGEERATARRALEALPEPDREILRLREVCGLPYEEIQSRMKIRYLGTVRSRLHKARESLRRAWRALRP